MVEPILYASFGFLLATLLWLLFLPAFWRRAVRLTTKRLVNRLPVSASEIIAAQDRLRAEHAMAVRAVERRAEREATLAAQAQIGAARAHATELRQRAEIADLKARIATLEAEAVALKADLERSERRAAAVQAELDAGRAAEGATAEGDRPESELTRRSAEVLSLRAQAAPAASPEPQLPQRAALSAADAEALRALRARLDEVADAIVSAAGADEPDEPRPRETPDRDRVRLVSPVS